jgi:hypothetical protein
MMSENVRSSRKQCRPGGESLRYRAPGLVILRSLHSRLGAGYQAMNSGLAEGALLDAVLELDQFQHKCLACCQ